MLEGREQLRAGTSGSCSFGTTPELHTWEGIWCQKQQIPDSGLGKARLPEAESLSQVWTRGPAAAASSPVPKAFPGFLLKAGSGRVAALWSGRLGSLGYKGHACAHPGKSWNAGGLEPAPQLSRGRGSWLFPPVWIWGSFWDGVKIAQGREGWSSWFSRIRGFLGKFGSEKVIEHGVQSRDSPQNPGVQFLVGHEDVQPHFSVFFYNFSIFLYNFSIFFTIISPFFPPIPLFLI